MWGYRYRLLRPCRWSPETAGSRVDRVHQIDGPPAGFLKWDAPLGTR